MAGRVPRLFITGGPDRYHIAFKAFFTLKGLGPLHIRDIHIRNLICSMNKQEPLNGDSRTASGTPAAYKESPIFRMMILRHNYIKPHGGMACRMPAEAACIHMHGTDRWLTLIQHAVSAA